MGLLLASLDTLRHQLVRSSSFARDALSRVNEAMERCARISDGIEARLDDDGVDRKTYNDVRIGVQTILDSVSGFMAAHDASVSSTGRPSRSSLFLGEEEGQEISVLNNYFGIGLDAKIAFDFDRLRSEHPEKCRSRMKNQMWYALMGSKEMLFQSCKNLHRRLEVNVDGRQLKLPKLQGIVVLNIPSYMGGTNLWGHPGSSRGYRGQSFNDGYLEIVAIKNSTEVGVGLGLRLFSPLVVFSPGCFLPVFFPFRFATFFLQQTSLALTAIFTTFSIPSA
jgi:diacylglycerol kinase (ATP)